MPTFTKTRRGLASHTEWRQGRQDEESLDEAFEQLVPPDATGAGSTPAAPADGPSLRARAIAMLSRREHSRAELRRKLSAFSQQEAELDALLDDLEQGNWLSNERFVQSLVHRKASRFGARKILAEMKEHRLDADKIASVREQLKLSEYERALAAWQKKFAELPANPREYARQMRFMLARGFDSAVAARILGGRPHEQSEWEE